MKKLVYLLVLSLCLNGMTGFASVLMSARAEKKSEAAFEVASSEKSKKKSGKDKSNKTEVEKEYKLDLDKNSQVRLSDIIKLTKMDIKLKNVKSIELVKKSHKKYISWEKDEENEKDYIFTVLKNFKEVRLHIFTKKEIRLLVLQNGAKAKAKKRTEEKTGESIATDEVEVDPEPEAHADELPAQTEQAIAAEAPVEKAPAEEKPVEETPAEEAPAEKAETAPAGQPGDTEEKQTEVETGEGAVEPAAPPEAVEADQEAAVEGQTGEDETRAETAESQAQVAEEQGETAEGQPEATEGQDETTESQAQAVGDQGADTEPQSGAEGTQAESGEDQKETEGTQPGTADGQPGSSEGEDKAPETPADTGAGQTEAPQGGEGQDPAQQDGGALIPAEAEGWFKRGTDLQWGTLQEVVGRLTGGETVYIQSGMLLAIKEAPLQLLSTVVMVPDMDVFKGSYIVCISTDDPTVVTEPTLFQPIQLTTLGEKADLYVWVKLDETAAPETGEQDGEADKPVITVTATGLVETGWSRTQPQFMLSGIPEGKTWSYAAIIYDERIVPITDRTYIPEQEGVYTLRFAMLDELGDIVSASDKYSLQLDWTAPEVTIGADESTSYTLNITATDNISGLDKVSVDGGKTWHSMEEGSYTVTESEETTFAAGKIQVSDVAGNVFKSEEEYTVSEVESEEEGEEGEGEEGDSGDGGGGGGGGGSGDESNTPKLPHSSGDGEEGIEYDALELELPDGPMEQLTVGGEPMALTLVLASAQRPNAFIGMNRPFTARLRHWEDASDDDAPNTLVLSAVVDDDLGDVFTYEWHFNGEVYRMLANSGIKYVALEVCDAVAAFPTVGFTGGTRFTELKMQGVSTRKFDYTLSMRMNLDPSHVSAMNEYDYSQDCDLSIHTDVEDKNYELSNSPQSMMYFYNVFVGPEDMMDQPFGEYDAAA